MADLSIQTKPWNPFQKFAFRYLFSYLFLYIFPFPFNEIPFVNWLTIPWDWFATTLVSCSSSYIFHIAPDKSHMATGSGDQLFRWIELATYAGISLPIAIIWSALDKKRKNYARLFSLLRLWSMLFVSSNMLGYGASKIIPSQFPPIHDYWQLTERVGDMSPMGILWTFMSASAPYTIFTGIVETVTGILLALPPTMILGALLSIAVSVQLVMFNMCYDVPVKILSLHLLILSCVIVSPEISQLLRIFILRTPGKQKLFAVPTIFKRGKLNITLWLIIWIFLAVHFVFSLMRSEHSYRTYTKGSTESGSLVGTWTVKSVQSDNGDQQKYFDKWQTLSISGQKYASVSFSNGEKVWLTSKISDDQKEVDLSGKQSGWSMHCEVERPDPEHIVLSSSSNGGKTTIHCERWQPADFLLLNRGFHWVNETPFNR